jgi:hypothetical protein
LGDPISYRIKLRAAEVAIFGAALLSPGREVDCGAVSGCCQIPYLGIAAQAMQSVRGNILIAMFSFLFQLLNVNWKENLQVTNVALRQQSATKAPKAVASVESAGSSML